MNIGHSEAIAQLNGKSVFPSRTPQGIPVSSSVYITSQNPEKGPDGGNSEMQLYVDPNLAGAVVSGVEAAEKMDTSDREISRSPSVGTRAASGGFLRRKELNSLLSYMSGKLANLEESYAKEINPDDNSDEQL